MNLTTNHKIALVFGVVLLVVVLVHFDVVKFNVGNSESVDAVSSPVQTAPPSSPKPAPAPSVRYFSSASDKVVLSVTNQTVYTDNLKTQFNYSAVDSSGKNVHFRSGDKVFVRILGITRLYNDNVEIFHPDSDDTIFSGNITFPGEGVYLVKACLGPSINLDSTGAKVWPFGCFEDTTSVQMNVYEK